MAIEEVEYQDVELQEVVKSDEAAATVNNNFALDVIADLEVCIDIKIGDVNLTVAELNSLAQGQTFKLNQSIDEPLQLILNNKVIGWGKLVVVDDHFGIELIKI